MKDINVVKIFKWMGIVGVYIFSLGIFWKLFLLLPILAKTGFVIAVLGFGVSKLFSRLVNIVDEIEL